MMVPSLEKQTRLFSVITLSLIKLGRPTLVSVGVHVTGGGG